MRVAVALLLCAAGCATAVTADGGLDGGSDAGARDGGPRDAVADATDCGPDLDGDGVADSFEASPPYDADGDGIPNIADTDDDGDGVPTRDEGPPPGTCQPVDTDADGTPDYLDLDSDDDGVPDSDELSHGTSRTSPDTDGDGLTDLVEIFLGLDPLVPNATLPAGYALVVLQETDTTLVTRSFDFATATLAAPADVALRATGVVRAGYDPTPAVVSLVPSRGVGPHGETGAMPGVTYDHADATTFYAVVPGTTLTFDVGLVADPALPVARTQRVFVVELDAVPAGGAPVSTLHLAVLYVPPSPPGP